MQTIKMNNTSPNSVRIRPIIQTADFNGYTVNITQASDCYNGLIYKDGLLVACVAAGLHEGINRVIEKAILKVGKH